MIGKHSMQLLARHFFWNNFFVRCGRPLSLFFLICFCFWVLKQIEAVYLTMAIRKSVMSVLGNILHFSVVIMKNNTHLISSVFLTVSQFLDKPRLYIWQWLLERTLSVLYETFYVLWVVLCKITEICFRSSIWFAKGPIKSEKNLWK